MPHCFAFDAGRLCFLLGRSVIYPCCGFMRCRLGFCCGSGESGFVLKLQRLGVCVQKFARNHSQRKQ